MSLEAYADAALSFANTLRHISGLMSVDALEPGEPGDSAFCPISTTAGAPTMHPTFGLCDGWQVGGVALLCGPRGGTSYVVHTFPEGVREFMAAFDAGMYPELIASGFEMTEAVVA